MNSYFEKKTKFNVLVPVTCDWQKKQDVHPQIFFQASFSLPGPAWQMCCSSQRPNPDSKLHFPTCQLLPKGLHDTKRNRTALEPTQLRGTNLSLVISLDNFPWTFETRIHCRLPLQSANIAAVAAEGIVCQCKSGRKTKRYSCHCCNHRPELKRSWCSSHMKRHLKGVEQQDSPSNVTKYYACHEISVLRLILVTNETSPSNVTKYCACHEKWHSKKWRKRAENGWCIISSGGRFENDPTMTRTWTGHLAPARSLAEVIFRALGMHVVFKITTFCTPAIYPNFTKYRACHEEWHCNITNIAPATKSGTPPSPNIAPVLVPWATLLWATVILWLDWTATLQNCSCTELLLYWTVTYWAVTVLSCYLTELLLDWTVTLLSCYVTDLLLYRTGTWLNCYFTELSLYSTVTLLNYTFTELLLGWTVTLLSCYFSWLLAFLFLICVTWNFLT